MNGAIDANQSEIVAGLRAVGASVHITSDVGHGLPDLVVGFRGANFLLECKAPGGRLTPAQREWHRDWRGNARVVRGLHDALEAVGAIHGAALPRSTDAWRRRTAG